MASSEPSDLSLDAAFLMRSFDTGHAKEAVEAVVGAKSDEPVRFEATSSLQDLCDSRLQIVVVLLPKWLCGRDDDELPLTAVTGRAVLVAGT
jgi:hypothetical protein